MGRIYVNGALANDPISVNVGNMYLQDEVYVGYRGGDNSYCNCDLAELEIYTRKLTDNEIHQIYSKFLSGSECP